MAVLELGKSEVLGAAAKLAGWYREAKRSLDEYEVVVAWDADIVRSRRIFAVGCCGRTTLSRTVKSQR